MSLHNTDTSKQYLYLAALLVIMFTAMPVAAGGRSETPGGQTDTVVRAGDAWIRASVAGDLMGAGYVSIENTSAESLSLVGVAGDIAERIEMHDHVRVDGLSRMIQVEEIELPPGETTVLAPGGLHLMFMGIKDEFKEGDTHNLTLQFSAAPPLTVEFTVQPLNHTEMGSHDHE